MEHSCKSDLNRNVELFVSCAQPVPSLSHGEKGCWHQGYWRAPGAGHQTGKKLLGLRTIGAEKWSIQNFCQSESI